MLTNGEDPARWWFWLTGDAPVRKYRDADRTLAHVDQTPEIPIEILARLVAPYTAPRYH